MRVISVLIDEASLLPDENIVIFAFGGNEYTLPDYQGVLFSQQENLVSINLALIGVYNGATITQALEAKNRWEVKTPFIGHSNCSVRVTSSLTGKYLIKKSDLSAPLNGEYAAKVHRTCVGNSYLLEKIVSPLIGRYEVSNRITSSFECSAPFKIEKTVIGEQSSTTVISSSLTAVYQSERDGFVCNTLEGISNLTVSNPIELNPLITGKVTGALIGKSDIENVVRTPITGVSGFLSNKELIGSGLFATRVTKPLTNVYDIQKNVTTPLHGISVSKVEQDVTGFVNCLAHISSSLSAKYDIQKNVTTSLHGISASKVEQDNDVLSNCATYIRSTLLAKYEIQARIAVITEGVYAARSSGIMDGISASTLLIKSPLIGDCTHVSSVSATLIGRSDLLDFTPVKITVVGLYPIIGNLDYPSDDIVSVVIT